MTPELMTMQEVAEATRTNIETLRYWRKTETGPKSFRMGRRVLYRTSDVNAWIDACVANADK